MKIDAAPAPVRLFSLARPKTNKAFTKKTLDVMRYLVEKYRTHPDLIRIAKYLQDKTPWDTLRTDFTFLKSRIAYQDDPPGVEEVWSPVQTIINGYPEDCDGMAVAAATILSIQGFPVLLRAIEWRIDEFTHVYAVAFYNGGNVPFDLTLDQLGEERVYKRKFDMSIDAIGDYYTESMLSDAGEEPLELLMQDLYGTNRGLQRRAYFIMRNRYPKEMQQWTEMMLRQTGQTPFGLSDSYTISDPVDTALKVAATAGAVTGPVGAVVAVASGVVEGVKKAYEAIFGTSTPKLQPWPWTQEQLAEYTRIYPTQGGPVGVGDETRGVYGVLFDPVEDHDYSVLGSFSGSGAIKTGWQKISNNLAKGSGGDRNNDANGQIVTVQVVKSPGAPWETLPGKYRLTNLPPGGKFSGWYTARYDLIGTGAKSTGDQTSKVQANVSRQQAAGSQSTVVNNYAGALPVDRSGAAQVVSTVVLSPAGKVISTTGNAGIYGGLQTSDVAALLVAKLAGGGSLSPDDIAYIQAHPEIAQMLATKLPQNVVKQTAAGEGGGASMGGASDNTTMYWIIGGVVATLIIVMVSGKRK